MTERSGLCHGRSAGRVIRDPPARRPQGRAGHLSHEEKQAIRLAYLEGGGRITRLAT